MESSEPINQEVYDPLRKKWLKATPEEIVRQQLVQKMIKELFYPKELLSIEKSLKEPPLSITIDCPDRRIDLLCFSKEISDDGSLRPLLLIECKESILLSASAKKQVIGYNHFIRACFVAIAYPEGTQWGFYDTKQQDYVFFQNIPSYTKLVQAVKHARRSK
jgi:hypothetical protein